MDLRETSSAFVGYLLTHTAALVDRQADQVLQERLGIGTSQLRILRVLHQTPNVLQRVLADTLGQTEASISRQAKLLHEKGLVSSRINPKSKREHIMQLTPKGVQITEAAQEVMAQYFTPLFAILNTKEQTELQKSLQVLYNQVS
jgi:DNA-binding MarR family transcriptional regulator